MSDKAHKLTDDLLGEIEKKVAKEYRQASAEAQEKLDDYFRRFEIKDEKWRIMVANGKKTQKEYDEWRTGQMMIGKRWEDLRDSLAEDYHNANVIARSTVNGYMPEVYALNHNYATFEIEKGTGLDTSYTLYDRQTVERIMRDDPDILPAPGRNMKARIAAGKDIAWQEGQIQSVTMQAILQGESITNMSKRIAREMGETNHKSTIRYARTATTAAENAGRHDGYVRAANMGISMKQTWVATLDNRTRHEHRMLDGQTVDIDEPFTVDGYEIRYPGDPAAEGFLIWNCRCTTIAQLKGFERDLSNTDLRRNEKLEDMTYEEWKEAKAESQPITHAEEVGEAMKWSYINEYRKAGLQKSIDNPDASSIIKLAGNNKPRNKNLEKAIQKCINAEKPIFTEGLLAKNALNIKSKANYYDVVSHGTPKMFELFGEKAKPDILANILKARNDYEAGTPIRLLACEVGKADKNGMCAAQALANALGVPVEAPNDVLWVYSDGRLSVGPKIFTNTGSMVTFYPKE